MKKKQNVVLKMVGFERKIQCVGVSAFRSADYMYCPPLKGENDFDVIF